MYERDVQPDGTRRASQSRARGNATSNTVKITMSIDSTMNDTNDNPGVWSDPKPTQGDYERRIHRRLPAEIEVTLHSEHNFFTGFTQNISEGGLFIATHQIAPVGTQFRVTFMLQGLVGAVNVLCEVRWIRPYNDDMDAPPGIGVRFVDLDEDTFLAIRAFILARDPIFYDD